jgi:glycosyltransferase involved in cell wall biosynthesis
MAEGTQKISILVISKNAKNTIRRLLDSISAQTYPYIEIVSVDSSNDGTEDILEEYKRKSKFSFKLLFQKPMGCGAAKTLAFRNASGNIITGLDSDDYIPPGYIEKLVKPFNERNNVIGVYVSGIIVSSAKNMFSEFVKLYEDITMFKDAVFYDKPHKYLIALRRDVAEAAGEYDENAEVAEDLIHGKKANEILENYMSQGYVLETADTHFISERQAHTFKHHWKKCVWYAKALVNKDYIKSYKKDSIIKIGASIYISILPFMLFILLAFNMNAFVIGVAIAPFLLSMLYLGYRAYLKRIVTWKLVLLPVYIYYRAFFTFAGILYNLLIKTNMPLLIVRCMRIKEEV